MTLAATYGARIRGAGVVCALGTGSRAVQEAVAAGREFAAFTGPSSTRAAYPALFDPARDLPPPLGRRMGRQLAMSIACVIEAVGPGRAYCEDPSDTGIVAATAHGPIDETVDFIAGTLRDGPQYASPLLFSGSQHCAMVGMASRQLGVRGPATVVSNGEVSFETALLVALAGLRAGRMRRAIVVGADAHHILYSRALDQFGLVTDAAEPIDPAMRRTMHGSHVGEGAGALFLEWEPRQAGGVYVDAAALGAAAARSVVAPARVDVMATGEISSAHRHAALLATLDVGGAEVSYPAARFGAFASLSAVAVAVEAARRLRGETDAGATLFVTVPSGAKCASVVLSGGGG